MKSISALLALVALAGCAAPPPLDIAPPSGEWVLEWIGGSRDGGLERPTLIFGEGERISGFAGCNRYFGRRTSNPRGGSYFSGIGATKMACAEPAMDLEQRYLAGLESARDARVTDGQLVLFDADDQEIMRFAPGVETRRTPS